MLVARARAAGAADHRRRPTSSFRRSHNAALRPRTAVRLRLLLPVRRARLLLRRRVVVRRGFGDAVGGGGLRASAVAQLPPVRLQAGTGPLANPAELSKEASAGKHRLKSFKWPGVFMCTVISEHAPLQVWIRLCCMHSCRRQRSRAFSRCYSKEFPRELA